MSLDNGQAGDGPDTLDSIGSFLTDNPDADSGSENDAKEPTADEPEEDNSDADTEDAPADDDEGDKPESDEAEQTSGLKFKVPVKGEDGTETTVEVDQKELIAGYQRHADYTRKTMELGNKEREITQKVAQSFEENRARYLQQSEFAQTAVKQLAGLRSPEEMAQLAHTDPAQWVQEQQRQAAINGMLGQIQQGMQYAQAETQRTQLETQKKAWEHAWSVLSEQKIDKPMLQSLFTKAAKTYNIPAEKFANVYDPQVVLMMRDAVAYQELKDKKAVVTKKVQESPKLPATRQSVPKNEQQARAINQRFTNGKAKLNDLAAFIANS